MPPKMVKEGLRSFYFLTLVEIFRRERLKEACYEGHSCSESKFSGVEVEISEGNDPD